MSVKRALIAIFLLASSLALPVGSAYGQITSTIHGTVRDSQGAVLPGVTITITSPSLLRGTVTVITADGGRYRIPGIQAGVYELTAQLDSFAVERVTGIDVALDREVPINITMTVAGVTEEVTVTAELPMVRPTQSDLQVAVDTATIDNIPLNGREFLDLVKLVPGAASRPSASDQGANVTFFGERSITNSFLADGLDNNDSYTRNFAEFYIQDTIQEFNVLIGGYQAEFGRASGAVANVITRSGTNNFGGRVWAFFRDDALDSSNVEGQEAPQLSRQEVGFFLGGPIARDKTFFFGSFNLFREERGINFDQSLLPQIIVDGYFTPSLGREPFDQAPKDTRYTTFLKADHRFNDKNVLFVTVNINRGENKNFLPDPNRGFAAPPPGTLVLPSIGSDLTQDQTSVNARYTAFFSQNAFLESSFRWANLVFQENKEKPSDAEQLFPITFIPTFQIWMSNASPIGEVDRSQDQFQWIERLSYFKGAHSLKFGVDLNRVSLDHTFLSAPQTIIANPIIDVNYQTLGLDVTMLRFTHDILSDDKSANATNNQWAVFAQDNWEAAEGLTVNVGLRYDYASLYSDDKNNIGPRIGVAWDLGKDGNSVVRASWGRFYNQFIMEIVERTPELGGVQFINDSWHTLPRGGGHINNPSIGGFGPLQDSGTRWLASPSFYEYLIPEGDVRTSGDISITGRGEPFIVYDLLGIPVPDPVNAPILEYGSISELTGGRLTPEEALVILNDFFPHPPPSAALPGADPTGSFVFLEEAGASSINTGRPLSLVVNPRALDGIQVMERPHTTPYTDSFNVGIEQALGGDLSIDAELFIRRSKNLQTRRITNLRDVPISNTCAGNTTDGGECIRTIEPRGFLDTNAVTIALRKRFSSRYSFLASYTYTDAEDNFSTLRVPPASAETSFLFNNQPELDVGRSLSAPKNVFVFSGLWRLPYGFDLSGVMNAQSARPFNAAGLPLDSDGDSQFDNRLIGTEKGGFLSDSLFNIDLRIAKEFRFSGGQDFVVLFEIFNVTNRANPFRFSTACGDSTGDGLPDAAGCGAAFGTGATVEPLPGREIQIGFRFNF